MATDPETVARIDRVLTLGSSFPSVVETSSGSRWVMKLAGTGPGRRALATEYIALGLARHLGLRVPAPCVIDLPPDLPWDVGTDEFYEAVQRSAGLNLGIAFIPDAVDLRATDLASLPADFLDQLGAVDALLQNVDRTSANPNIIRDAQGLAWAIDFGACLLVDRLARGVTEPKLVQASNHFLAAGSATAQSSARAREMAGAIKAEILAEIVDALPAPWLADLTLTHAALLSRLENYVETVATRPNPARVIRVEKTLKGKVAWVTGAGTGIGESGAVALARDGAAVVLTGRRKQPLEAVAERIAESGGEVLIRPADVTDAAAVGRIAEDIRAELGRLDILVNNAGSNIPDRTWQRLTPEGIDKVIHANLSSAFYVVQAVLPIMRAQKDGVLIHTSSWAGRWIGPLSGPAYTAAKHGMVAMSHTINLEECLNGIRSCVICPNEVATPIMANRPVPEKPETLARMLQPQDLGELIAFVARQPPHVCINEVLISPTHNRGYIGQMQARQAQMAGQR